MKKFIKGLNSSKFLLALTFVLNIALIGVISFFVGLYVYSLISIVGLLVMMIIMNHNNDSASYKIMWMFVVVVIPVFGVALYLQIKTTHASKNKRKLYLKISHQIFKGIDQKTEALENLKLFNKNSSNLSKYITTSEKWPVYNDSVTSYFSEGQEFYADLFKQLKMAKKFILLEYFIVQKSELWNELFEVLRLKAREGVEIKMLYDDYGCIDRFDDKKYFKKLIHHGIDAIPFNKIRPALNMFSQYRDHRKIIVIDGEVAYTGGVNIGDEYINKIERFGHWKDAGIKVVGPAVWSFTSMFFTNWQLTTKKQFDINKYKAEFEKTNKIKEFIQPYGTGPISKTPTARDIYLKIINSAQNYVYITTPYFILDHELMQALKLASMSGVDIKIFMPGIPDQKWVHYLSRSYYADLIKVGIKIYEFTEGFLHSKVVLTDDVTASVGSVNMDFRSMYLHFEAGVVVHNAKSILKIKDDFDYLISTCHLVTLRDIKKRKWYEKISAQFLRFFAPLM